MNPINRIFNFFPSFVSCLVCFPVLCMGGGGGGGDVPEVETPELPDPSPTPVTESDEEVQDAKRNAQKAEAKKKGRKKSILTGDLQPAETSKKKLLGG